MPTYYFEIVGAQGASGTGTVTLRRNGTSTDDATIDSGSFTTIRKRLRSSSFTPPSGQTTYLVRINGDGTRTINSI